METPQTQKICVLCAIDCSTLVRYQDPQGNYYCAPCYEQAQGQTGTALKAGLPAQAAPALSQSAGKPRLSTVVPDQEHASAPARSGRIMRSEPLPRASESFLESPRGLAWAMVSGFLLLLVLARIYTAILPLYLVLFFLAGIVIGIAVLVSAFRTDRVQGFLTLLVPFYSFYYVFGVCLNQRLKALVVALLISLVGIIFLPWSAGLQSAADGFASAVAAGTNETRRDLAGYSLTVIPGSAGVMSSTRSTGPRSTTVMDGKRIELQSNVPLRISQTKIGQTDVMIVNNELFVDFKPYGRLNPNDRIRVEHGAVSINDQPARQGGGTVRITVR